MALQNSTRLGAFGGYDGVSIGSFALRVNENPLAPENGQGSSAFSVGMMAAQVLLIYAPVPPVFLVAFPGGAHLGFNAG